MVLTSVELDDETILKKNFCGISYRNLINMGIKSIEKNQELNELNSRMEKNINIMQEEIRRLSRENLSNKAKIIQMEMEKNDVL